MFLLGLVAGGAVLACSAEGDKDSGLGGGSGNGTGAGAFGNVGNSGNTPGGGAGSGGENVGGINVGAAGGGTAGGGTTGGGGGGTDVGQRGPNNINRCADAAKFQGGAPGLQMVYPYNDTIFPRGLAAATLMWNGTQAQEVLVEARSSKFTYVECFSPAPDPARQLIPQDAWDGAGGWSDGPGDPLTITVTVLSGGQKVSGTVTVKFALATMKGAIYYNSYNSRLNANNGAVLKVLPGDHDPTVFLAVQGVAPLGPCISCHALSANGATMTANHHFYPGAYESRGYDVASGQAVQVSAGIPEAGFAALYPDGQFLLTNGPPNTSVSAFFPTAPGNVAALVGGPDTNLHSSKVLDISGRPVATNWDVPHAQMPMFSPDGRKVVYNDYDNGQGHSLWVADFDNASKQFSNKRQIFNDPTLYPSWPFFTPDGNQVVFALGTNSEYVSQLPDPILATAAMRPASRGQLRVVDVNTGAAVELGRANGRGYLPPDDQDWEYFTTVSPVAAGGFFWAMFTSRRAYGNLVNLDKNNPDSKKIWVTAISIGQAPGTDPSHPAFFLPGQEIESGNVRAFAALEPCKEDGASCSAGSECCSGYCTNIDATTGRGICGQVPVDSCSKAGDICETNADCCTGPDNGAEGRELKCLGKYCDFLFQ
ncbi:MAG: hypothetical protein FJ104_00695 [Deltaproteobacteria bacterium]|nr:hypothetical protein [Deltaproteobacteria bacterium]